MILKFVIKNGESRWMIASEISHSEYRPVKNMTYIVKIVSDPIIFVTYRLGDLFTLYRLPEMAESSDDSGNSSRTMAAYGEEDKPQTLSSICSIGNRTSLHQEVRFQRSAFVDAEFPLFRLCVPM